MKNIELSIDSAYVDFENDSIMLHGVDITEIVAAFKTYDLLREMEYEDVLEYVNEVETEKKELLYER